MQANPSSGSILKTLTCARLVELGRIYDIAVPARVKDTQVATLVASGRLDLPSLINHLQRDELKAACRQHGLEATGRARSVLASRLHEAAGTLPSLPEGAEKVVTPPLGAVPAVGDIVQVRRRQYLVEAVDAEASVPGMPPSATRVSLVGLDDDNQGRRTDVFWGLELGARIQQAELQGLGALNRVDPSPHLAAYLNALRWNTVTATDATLFQAPFRAGIQILPHQMLPLKKALELPRANLFLADDVGLGKTIEAGLVLQELLLRQQVDFVLISAPAAVCHQWRNEMEKRFGLSFETYNRAFVARRRQERGFGTNPWTTHNRFIISHQMLRRPEYREPLLQVLKSMGSTKTLLILDEAHAAAPASQSKYAVDSQFTHVVRDVAPLFKNRLFLSATPHNGHSNSFSALLEILDPQRFTRGVPIHGTKELAPVMVRRLKSDLRRLLPEGGFPDRQVVQIDLSHRDGHWQAASGGDAGHTVGSGTDFELELSRLFDAYVAQMRGKQGRSALVFVNLQKRLLSSTEAFARTLGLHAQRMGVALPERYVATVVVDDPNDEDDDQPSAEARELAEVEEGSAQPMDRQADGYDLLRQLLRLSDASRHRPDAKTRALIHFIHKNMCPAAGLGRDVAKTQQRWSERRIIVFTEYADTKRYLVDLLQQALQYTDQGESRVIEFHGGMSDDQREATQRAFNAPPAVHPVRILVATDAAREGLNLQNYCADLFHYDIPWNPARMEQRNGRIDRALQRSPVVRCHYFHYTQRPADAVLRTLMRKVDVIGAELGSLSAVVLESCTRVMAQGIHSDTEAALAAIAPPEHEQQTVVAELEQARARDQTLRDEIDNARTLLDKGMRRLNVDGDLLRQAIDVGLQLRKIAPLTPQSPEPSASGEATAPTYLLPKLPQSWDRTLDTLRGPRARDESEEQWRGRSPLPVSFHTQHEMRSDLNQLHLAHPFVKRVLGRLTAHGVGTHDLSRVGILRSSNTAQTWVMAVGRLCLFGAGATRLHDELICVVAPWLEGKGAGHLVPVEGRAEGEIIGRLFELMQRPGSLKPVGRALEERLTADAEHDFATLWPHLVQEADAKRHLAHQQLDLRGREEAAALQSLLATQAENIHKSLAARRQSPLTFSPAEQAQARQMAAESRYMTERLKAIAQEATVEPAQIRDLYRVVLHRMEPTALLYIYPEAKR